MKQRGMFMDIGRGLGALLWRLPLSSNMRGRVHVLNGQWEWLLFGYWWPRMYEWAFEWRRPWLRPANRYHRWLHFGPHP